MTSNASFTRRAGKAFKSLKNTATESPATLSKKLDLQSLFTSQNNTSNFAEKENCTDFFGTIGSIGRKRSRSVGGDKTEGSFSANNEKKPKLDEELFNSPFLVFAIPLAKLMAKQKLTHPELAIPLVVKQCLDYMRQHCMDLEGVFRISGVHDAVKALRGAYDSGQGEVETQRVLEENQDPHNVAGLLKLFLRSLPEPVLTYERFDPFVSLLSIRQPFDHNNNTNTNYATSTNEEEDEDALKVQLHVLRQIVASLPPENHALLATIIGFLHDLGNNHKEATKMETSSLARVVGPNLMWAPPTSTSANTGGAPTSHADCQQGFSNIIGVITLLIDTHPAAFQPEIPLILSEIETETPPPSPGDSSSASSSFTSSPSSSSKTSSEDEEEAAKQQRIAASTLRRKHLLQQLHQNAASLKLKLQEDPERLPSSPLGIKPQFVPGASSRRVVVAGGGSRIRKSLNPANILKHAKSVKDRLTEHLPQSLMPLLGEGDAINLNDPSCKVFYFDATYYPSSASLSSATSASSLSPSSLAEGKSTRKAEEFFFHNGLAPRVKIDSDNEPLSLEVFLSRFFNGGSGCHEVIEKLPGAKVISVYKPTLPDFQQLLLVSYHETESPASASSSSPPRLRTPLTVVGNTLLIGFHAETFRKVFINQQLQSIWQREKTPKDSPAA